MTAKQLYAMPVADRLEIIYQMTEAELHNLLRDTVEHADEEELDRILQILMSL